MAFDVGTAVVAGLLALSADFLDSSFLITVSLTMYAPCCGWRDNDRFFSLDRFLLFVGCSCALTLRTVLLFNHVDPLQWDGFCHLAAALMLGVFFVEVLMKWRRAVYGRSQLASSLGRRLPEEREGRRQRSSGPIASNTIEDGNKPLALDDAVASAGDQSSTSVNTRPTQQTVGEKRGYDFSCLVEKASHLFIPGMLVIFVAAGDGQTLACEKLAHDQLDLAVGESLGLICSTLLAVLLGGFLKWYLHDTHLLLYMALIFFGLMVTSVQGSIVDMLRGDLPGDGLPSE